MDVASDTRPLEGNNKRVRDSVALSDQEFVNEEPAVFKRLCAGLEIEDSNISSILDTVAEGDEADDQNELDEAQERLLFGVMRSLEEELGVSTDHTSTVLVDSESCSTAEDPCCLNVCPDITSSRPCDASYFGEGPLSSNGVTSDLDLSDLLEKSFQLTCQQFPQRAGTLHAEHPPYSVNDKSQQYKKSVDIGYLLEASDDELGISPSPGSESPGSEAGLASCSLQEADYTSQESTYDPLDHQSWQFESDWFSGGHFDLDFESDPSSQEWIKSAVSSLKAGLDPSIWGHSPLDAAASACLEPACASH